MDNCPDAREKARQEETSCNKHMGEEQVCLHTQPTICNFLGAFPQIRFPLGLLTQNASPLLEPAADHANVVRQGEAGMLAMYSDWQEVPRVPGPAVLDVPGRVQQGDTKSTRTMGDGHIATVGHFHVGDVQCGIMDLITIGHDQRYDESRRRRPCLAG